MFTKKTKLQLCARNLSGVEHDLVSVTYPTDLVGAINGGDVIGDTVLTVDGFSGGDIPTGCVMGIAGDDTTYYVSTGGSATSITIDPPLRADAANDAVVTIYPHFDITEYWTNDVSIEQRAEFTQAELILDKPIRIELFNKNSVFYDRDTHSTGWASTTSYFTTYNAQGTSDNQYIRISALRNGTWYQKYNGKIKQHTLEIDEINKSVSFEAESVFYALKDAIVSEIDDLYNLHKYTTATRKTKTPSGRYVDVIRSLFKYAGVLPKDYAVTNLEKSYSGLLTDLYNYCVLTIGTHTIIPGELITVDIDNPDFDGTHIVYSVTSTTITYYFDSSWEYTKDDVNATVAAGNTDVVLQTGLGAAYNNFYGKCKFATADTTIYSFAYVHSTKTITVDPVLSNEATINEDVYLSYPKLYTSAGASGSVRAHRIYFDLNGTSPTDYFNVTHQGHAYNLLDLFWITEKWMVQDVEAETAFDIMRELCLQLGACANLEYIDGIAYGFFRSKINASTSKLTFTNSKIIGEPKLNGNWQFYSPDGVVVKSEVRYWYEQSLETAFCYTEDLSTANDNFRFLSAIPSTSVLAYERYSSVVNANSFNNLSVGDFIQFRDDDTIYEITGVSGELITINPPLRKSTRLGEKFWKLSDKILDINYSNCFNIKLKYPNIFLTDITAADILKYSNNGTATLGLHPMSFYASEILRSVTGTLGGVTLIKNMPCADGWLGLPNGDLLAFAEYTATDSYVYTCHSRYILNSDKYQIVDTTFPEIYGIQHGYIYTKNTDDNTVKLYSVIVSAFDPQEAATTIIMRTNLEMNNAGESAETLTKDKKRRFGVRPSIKREYNSNLSLSGTRGGRSPITANANEFSYYKLEKDTSNFGFQTGAVLGTTVPPNSMFLNHSVLNPDYDDLVYADAGHARVIQKGSLLSPAAASVVFSGVAPAVDGVKNFIVNHGEGANQEYYYCLVADGTIIKNDGAAWTDSAVLMPDISGTGGIINTYAKWGMSSTIGVNTANVKIIRKSYDNVLVIADVTDFTVMIVDITNDRIFYIEDTSGLDSIGGIDIQDFTNWYDNNPSASDSRDIFENDICAHASKLAYKFYSKNRRPYEIQSRDVDMGYLDYTLFDRMTIDSSILSAASGSPKFYVYGYRFDCRTHDHKLTLLESVE